MNTETRSTTGRPVALLAVVVLASTGLFAADTAPKRWKEDELVKAFSELVSSGGLEAAVRTPALPKDPPQAAFLDALAWYAAGAPKKAGNLTRKQLDEQIKLSVDSYQLLLKAKAEKGEDNDYARTRTWKLIQKYTLLGEEMSKPSRKGRYAYPALHKPGGPEVDAWDREHTLRSPDE